MTLKTRSMCTSRPNPFIKLKVGVAKIKKMKLEIGSLYYGIYVRWGVLEFYNHHLTTGEEREKEKKKERRLND